MIEYLLTQAFPTLTDEALAVLRSRGELRDTAVDDVIFEAGIDRQALVVVLSGRADVVDRSDGADRLIVSAGPGEFIGELGILTGQAAYATCIVREAGEILVVPAAATQAVISTDPVLGDLLVPAFAARRQLLTQTAGSTLTMIGAASSAGVMHLAEFASRNRIPYRQLEPDDPLATALLERLGVTSPAVVWVVVRGEVAMPDPSPLHVAKALRLHLAFDQVQPADLAIVGTGPAGLAAAVYGASEGLDTVAVDDVAIGGQAGASSRIENYLGFPTGIAGGDLAYKAGIQALKFGARIAVPHRATALRRVGDLLEIDLDGIRTIQARSVVIATGARYRRLDLADQERFEGAGIYYAATELEARRCRDAVVVIVGGGNAAGQAAMFMAGSARTVHLVHRGADLRRDMSEYLVARLEHAPHVRIHLDSEVTRVDGGERLETVTIRGAGGTTHTAAVDAVFVLIGAEPCTAWLGDALALDERGFVLTGPDVAGSSDRVRSSFETSLSGVFAVGDVRHDSVKRVASAVGEGSAVVAAVHRYLAAAGTVAGRGQT